MSILALVLILAHTHTRTHTQGPSYHTSKNKRQNLCMLFARKTLLPHDYTATSWIYPRTKAQALPTSEFPEYEALKTSAGMQDLQLLVRSLKTI
jgi:hypothetical protein